MKHYTNAWKKSFDFSGRALRAEFWAFSLINYAIMLLLISLGLLLSEGNLSYSMAPVVPYIIFLIIIIIPTISVTVRRLHDIDKSGGWFFIQLIPTIGYIVIIVFACTDGTSGDNKYGADPKNRKNTTVSF